MAQGRYLVFPQALGFGARAVAVPDRGHVLCASAFYVFRLSDGGHVPPEQWYERVASAAGPMTIPDSVVPLPGAELLLLGNLDPVVGDAREASIRCGPIDTQIVLRADPDNPDAPIVPDPTSAVWHEDDNPLGRGGPDDDRVPLVLSVEDRERPIWLGPTAFDHPARLRRAGTASSEPKGGWPADAQPSVLCEAHPAFWAEALRPGEPLAIAGLAGSDIDTHLPPYRVTIVSGHADETTRLHTATRIHGVSLIPSENLGAVFYRLAIPLGRDLLGESVVMLIAALEDADSPVREEDEYLAIANDRYDDPVRMLDDRPLLPKALAATVTLPFATEGDDENFTANREAAEAWALGEVGLSENPFGGDSVSAPEGLDFDEQIEDAATPDDDTQPPDANAVEPIALAALAESKRRHGGTGLDTEDLDPDAPREPVQRGATLDAEIGSRLSAPYKTRHEMAIAAQVKAAEAGGALDADEALTKVANARAMNAYAPLFWPALNDEEGKKFGDKTMERLVKQEFAPHIDISSAQIVADADGYQLAARRLVDLLAEETLWQGVEFDDCEVSGGSFANSRFENCTFRKCTFDNVNFSRAKWIANRFLDCEFRNLRMTDPDWMDCQFDRCVFDEINADNAAARDLAFSGGSWRNVMWTDALLVGIALRGIEMEDVTYMGTSAPTQRFENVTMHKVWAMTCSFPLNVFEDVESEHCCFLTTRLDESRFSRTRFVDVGFTNAVFNDAQFAPGCFFDACNFNGATFENTELAAVRFLKCSLATSVWSGVNAADAWFFGSILRGVDFKDTVLSRAVFADADLEGIEFDPEQTIGADFRGTVLADPGQR